MNVGWTEGLIVVGILVLLFGARKLPELGKSLGEGIKEFKKASKNITSDVDDTEQPSGDAPKA